MISFCSDYTVEVAWERFAIRTPDGDARLEKVSEKPEIIQFMDEDSPDRRRKLQCSPGSSAWLAAGLSGRCWSDPVQTPGIVCQQ